MSTDRFHSGTGGEVAQVSQVQLPRATTSTASDGKDREWVLPLHSLNHTQPGQLQGWKRKPEPNWQPEILEGSPPARVSGSGVFRNVRDQRGELPGAWVLWPVKGLAHP